VARGVCALRQTASSAVPDITIATQARDDEVHDVVSVAHVGDET
jgi:hypothetical protein